jgi:hypothetical protein
MAQRSMRRDRDNQLINQCREHVCLIWTRSADSHPGPRPVSRMTGRTHGICGRPPPRKGVGQCFDRIACGHMSGLLLQSHVTAGQDGIRTVSSQQPRGLT